jgi:hypothetical protein
MAATKDNGGSKVLIALQHFTLEGDDGRPMFIHPGQRVPADSAIVQGREHLFREKTEED